MQLPPVLITSSTDIAAVLRGDRERLRLSGEELDARVGWADRYTAKAENPRAQWGKRLIVVHEMADYWLESLGRSLVLMDRVEAERLVRQSVSVEPVHGLERVQVVRMTW